MINLYSNVISFSFSKKSEKQNKTKNKKQIKNEKQNKWEFQIFI